MNHLPSTKLVLLVDDEPDMCWALERILCQMEHHTVKAENANDALQLAQNNHFHLAFIDAKLPDMEGIDLIQQLRSLQPALPAILISGYFYDNDEKVQNWVEEGWFCDFVGKPFLLEQVRRVTQRALQPPP